MIARHVIIHGLVQGVYYRATTQQAARQFSINGWVRNCPNGTVEAVLEGDDKNVEQLLTWMRRGPSGARVSGVDICQATPKGATEFSIL